MLQQKRQKNLIPFKGLKYKSISCYCIAYFSLGIFSEPYFSLLFSYNRSFLAGCHVENEKYIDCTLKFFSVTSLSSCSRPVADLRGGLPGASGGPRSGDGSAGAQAQSLQGQRHDGHLLRRRHQETA